ncbi:hypothetical protein KQY30_31100 [Streptomyces sp. GMY02]|uniref:hypothetical protein n=1 Tax=Streptomyces sp. GMY02 TaxID=1333528 RepID=UPI001C2C6CF5|nr:hypothetical protein [Streptomyces sp. GMY02]QXE38019.1 hypothetical protein KQY30_31100 [Streptomyces sp. GMY02]
MTTAQRLAVIELLRAREFPAARGRSEVGTSGPGYHLAELAHGDGFLGDDDGARRIEEAEQLGAEHTALTEILTARYGEPDHLSLWSLRIRGGEGEEIPEPWRELSDGPRFLHLWRIEGRWLAVGLAGEDGEQPLRLMAAVTETDPP